jgi:hypothetical protein
MVSVTVRVGFPVVKLTEPEGLNEPVSPAGSPETDGVKLDGLRGEPSLVTVTEKVTLPVLP